MEKELALKLAELINSDKHIVLWHSEVIRKAEVITEDPIIEIRFWLATENGEMYYFLEVEDIKTFTVSQIIEPW